MNREAFRRLVKQHGEEAGDFDNPYGDNSPSRAILAYVGKLEAVAEAADRVFKSPSMLLAKKTVGLNEPHRDLERALAALEAE